MAKKLDYLNLAFLAILGVICLLQWDKERGLSHRVADLQKNVRDQEGRITQQNETIHHSEEDLADFKKRISDYQAKFDLQNATIRTNKAELFKLALLEHEHTNQIAEWEKAVEDYRSVVTNRDANIKVLLEQRETLVAANKQTAEKFNGLITDYNGLAEKYKDAVDRYNKLVARVSEQNQAQKSAEK